ncbi:MAG: glycosyltransferase family 2 protein [Chloroflexota bacterium]|nr:glycosyltransferase family 2 protein [Chloroflexota bacterium]
MKHSISAIVPVYNEVGLVASSLGAIDRVLQSTFDDYEIVVVESGSTDGTADACDDAAKRFPHVRIVHEGARRGYGSALRLGMARSTKELITFVTLDLPFDLATIGRAVPLLERADCVLSYRPGDPRGAGRRWQSIIYRGLLRLALGIRARNVNSSFKLLKRSTLEGIALRSTGWFIDAELVYWLERRGTSYIEIPVPLLDRTAGRSTVRLGTWLEVLGELVKFVVGRRRTPPAGGARESSHLPIE